ncbi:ankyrin repeat and LEM domain-containing protein 1 isoform X2 [Sorex araneus]|uniref:ankyrin repeat and LEM domain-containing protein 1 isoform X2 n=1 Tax=Sorex araneus TaxID=42254 RepID=UPI0024333A6F|nr:ankyrin repeat and LEM domain-containing protein 1 isoform X2 [Sorex araneus]
MHLAARACHPRGLRCLDALLRRGGDPNARSDEALTPLHVAAAWGCRPGLELLLSWGADPQLLDQDGLRAGDLAKQQGHHDCVHVLREFAPHTCTLSRTRDPDRDPAEPQEGGEWAPSGTTSGPVLLVQTRTLSRGDHPPECHPILPIRPRSLPDPLCSICPDPQGMGPASSRSRTLDRRAADKGGGKNAGPGPGRGLPCCLADPQAVPDTSSNASFVTAAEDPAPGPSLPARPATPAKQGPLSWEGPELGLGGHAGTPEVELCAGLQALALASPTTESCLDRALATSWQVGEKASAGEPCHRCSPGVPQSDLELLQGLRALGASPGPVTPFTRPHYLRRLREARTACGSNFSGHSPELAEALRTGQIPDAQEDEDALARQFERPDPSRRWREGVAKGSFTYLLLDPRETQDLLSRASPLSLVDRLRTFVRAIFYVGKGSRARPDAHLWEALGHHRCPVKQHPQASPKVLRILDIWASGRGVVSLLCFQHAVAAEAYTREACLVAALGIGMLTNQKQGHFYGVAANWPHAQRCRLGVHLLHRALLIFLAEGQRELRPEDIHERG